MSITSLCKSQMEVRKKGYKKVMVVNADKSWRKREENLIRIRKAVREDKLLKRRRQVEIEPKPQQLVQQVQPSNIESLLPSLLTAVWSDDATWQLKAIAEFRRLLSIYETPPIDQIINAAVVPRFVEFLARHDFPQLQFEAGWVLSNIAAGTPRQARVVIVKGAVPIFVHLLSCSPSDDVREQAVWALANVAGDSSEFRELVLNHGALAPLLAVINPYSTLSMLRTATWALANFCRGKPQLSLVRTKAAVVVLERLIHVNDEEVLGEACRALSYLTAGTKEKIRAVIQASGHVCPRLVELLLHPSQTVVSHSLSAVGNIIAGDRPTIQTLVDSGLLQCLLPLLGSNQRKNIKKKVCYTISGIISGTKAHIQAVIDEKIIARLVQLIRADDSEFDVKREAGRAVSNAANGCSHGQVKDLVEEGCLQGLCDLLDCEDPSIVRDCLDGLDRIMEIGEEEKEKKGGSYSIDYENVNVYGNCIEDCGGLEKILCLLSHSNSDIYNRVVAMIDSYWLEDDGDDDEQEWLT